MRMYSSKTMFRMDPTSDVGRNLSTTPQFYTRTLTWMEIYLFLKHNDVLGDIIGVLQKISAHSGHTLGVKRRRTLTGQILIQRLLHSGLGRRKGRKSERPGGERHVHN